MILLSTFYSQTKFSISSFAVEQPKTPNFLSELLLPEIVWLQLCCSHLYHRTCSHSLPQETLNNILLFFSLWVYSNPRSDSNSRHTWTYDSVECDVKVSEKISQINLIKEVDTREYYDITRFSSAVQSSHIPTSLHFVISLPNPCILKRVGLRQVVEDVT